MGQMSLLEVLCVLGLAQIFVFGAGACSGNSATRSVDGAADVLDAKSADIVLTSEDAGPAFPLDLGAGQPDAVTGDGTGVDLARGDSVGRDSSAPDVVATDATSIAIDAAFAETRAADLQAASDAAFVSEVPASADVPASGDAFGMSGQSCSVLGALACAGANQQQSLICSGGKWQVLYTCAADQRCDQSTGVCAAVLPRCVGHDPGYSTCSGADTVETCGPDLVFTTTATCTGTCQAGICLAPRCGDGKVEDGESCDDGNTVPADGCEPDCTKTDVVGLAAGRGHTCALLSRGNVRCWGGNDKGQLGLGNANDVRANKPYQNAIVGLGAPAIAIAAGSDHTCVVMVGGSIRCWGANDHGQLGLGHTQAIGDNEAPSADLATVGVDSAARAIATGGNCTCAILDDDTLRCWGENTYGQLGLGHTSDIGDNELPTRTSSQVSLAGIPLSVAVGGNHSCAILADGYTVRCWGRNGLGQLGLGTTDNVGDDELPSAVDPIVFPSDGVSDTAMVGIVAGSSRTCSVRMDGVMRCWGDNSDGGLGVGYAGARPLNKAIDWGLWSWNSQVRDMRAGAFHLCLTLANNQSRCWGINDKAQLGLADTQTLGDNESVIEAPPIDLGRGGDGFASYAILLAAGAAHTCVVLGDGNVRCWGANESGQLGLGYASLAPTDFVGGTPTSTPGQLGLVSVLHP